jgi:hypothetical protein
MERDHLEDTGVDERIILRWMFRKLLCGGMDWIELAQDRDRWRALVNEPSGSIKFGVFLV